MDPKEERHRVIGVLLQAAGPLGLDEVVAECGLAKQRVRAVLGELVRAGQVVEGRLLPDGPARQYRWAARWAKEAGRRAKDARRGLRGIVLPTEVLPAHKLEIDCEPVVAFHRYVIHEYAPPRDKRFCVFFQCSVRRPFSSSPSHASMRRAVRVATGADPARDFETCPVHVVVLASRIGPVPYELEDVYPANVGGGGVKHFRPEHYARVKGTLAERMAEYLAAHGSRYEHAASFTDGRYGEVMAEACRIAKADFPIFPDPAGARVLDMGGSKPRTYWQKYWIQLYREIVSWLDKPQRARAAARLKELDVTCQ
jgi:hypothetical protein